MPWHTNSTTEIGLSARFAPSSLDLLGEFLTESDDQLSIRNVGPCLFLSRDPSSTRGTAPLLPGPGTDGVSILDAFTPAARIVQVTALLRRAGGTLPIARCSIPIRIGESGCAVLGTESIEVGDYNVEVAQSASIADTVMRIGFDGIALEFRPGFAPSGNLTIGLTARAHVRRGERRELSLGVRSLGTLDESTYDQLFVRETLVFAKAESAPKRFLLGDASQNSTLGTLSLEVEAVEVR
jgi:hypothetical protein